jgi:hypothetical protein
MGTYRQPGVIKDTRFETARAAGEQISKTIVEDLEKKKKAEEMLKLKKQKLNESMYGLQLDVSKVPAASDKSLTASLRKTLNNELQYIYQLGLDSLKTGDNSEYLAAKAKFEGWVSKLPEEIGDLDYEANMYSKKGDQAMTWGNDPTIGRMFDNYNMEDGKDIDITYDRGIGTGVYSYSDDKGSTIINMNRNLKNVKSGSEGLIKYIEDPSDRLSKMWNKVSKGYKPSKFERDEISDTGKEVVAKYETYDYANRDIKNELMGVGVPNYKDPFENEYNQNNWEFFGFEGEFDDQDDEDVKKLKEVMIDWMITNKGKRSETRLGEDPVTKETKTRSTAEERRKNSAAKFARKFFNQATNNRRDNYNGGKMAQQLNDARLSTKLGSVKYFTVGDFKNNYTGDEWEGVVDELNKLTSSSDDVIRVNIKVLNDNKNKIISQAVPDLFRVMDGIEDFENSSSDFGTFPN